MTFQDAVKVTRELGKRYLWIDSLCIIQDSEEDWKKESRKMENVFENAYCTIAAASAKDSNEGFLDWPPAQAQYVKIYSSLYGPVYICTTLDDFRRDVENGPLNQRAWVLQERALSRRTIHFTTGQTYWECGYRVSCGTLS